MYGHIAKHQLIMEKLGVYWVNSTFVEADKDGSSPVTLCDILAENPQHQPLNQASRQAILWI